MTGKCSFLHIVPSEVAVIFDNSIFSLQQKVNASIFNFTGQLDNFRSADSIILGKLTILQKSKFRFPHL